jgi:hypothetical protein
VARNEVTITRAGLDWQFAWSTDNEEYGFLGELTARDAGERAGAARQGQLLASARTVFEVSGRWPVVMRLATIEPCKHAAPGTSEGQIREWVTRARAAGLNAVETFGWMPASYYLTVERETWPEYGRPELGRLASAEKLRLWSKLLHAQGMKFIAYNETSAVKGPDEWKVYNPYNRAFDPNDWLAPYYRERGMFTPNALKVGDLLGRQLAGSIKQFDWDGILMDSASQCMSGTASGLDGHGKPLTSLTPGQVGEQYLQAARAPIRGVKPEFKFLSQNAWASLVGRGWHFRRPLPAIFPTVKKFYEQEDWGAYNKMVDMWTTESDPESMRHDRYAATYDRLAVCLNTTIEVTHKPLLVWTAMSQWDNDGGGRCLGYVKPFLSTVLASRTTFNDHFEMYGGTMTGKADDPVNRSIRHYRRFAARYSEFLFDPELRWDQEPWTWVSLDRAPSSVMWEYAVYHRMLPDGRRRTIVHLLNLPPDRRIVADHDLPRSNRKVSAPSPGFEGRLERGLPEPLKDFTMHMRFSGEARPLTAWFISADSPDQDPVQLPIYRTQPHYAFDPKPTDWGADVHFNASRNTGLETWAMIVLEDQTVKN